MKRSEFEQARVRKYKPPVHMSASLAEVRIRQDVEAAEAAGVAWDPEGEPVQAQAGEAMKLPERLEVRTNYNGDYIGPAGGGVFDGLMHRRATFAEAVRRYNERPALVEGFLSDDKETFKRALRELLRLAGKEDSDGE